MDDKWHDAEDICTYLKVSNDTVYKWIKQKDLPSHRLGRRWMFKKEELDEWIRSGNAAEK